MQFSSKFRNRHLDFHRRTGRVLIINACVSAMAALFFGVIIPYAGPAEVSSTGLFGALFLIALGKAFLAIRRGDVAQHREWMIRAFAIGIGISTIRVLVAFMQRFMQLSPRALIGWSFWIGWSITFLAGEAWIRYTRRSRQTESVAGTGVGAPAVSGGL
ncbi:MAG: DUF2306 domain-containing protein [Thermoanaerobaculia bacterium]